MNRLKTLDNKDYEYIKAKEFEDLVISLLDAKSIRRQVKVSNRGDGRSGRIDILAILQDNRKIAIEIDRISPRTKSIFKLNEIASDEKYIILRSPFKIIKL